MTLASSTHSDSSSGFSGRHTHDELVAVAGALGVPSPETMTSPDLLKAIEQRRRQIGELDPAALRELLGWARVELPPGSGVEVMASRILQARVADYESLSPRALVALAALKGVKPEPDGDRSALIRQLRRRESFWDVVRRGRRRMVARLVSGFFDDSRPAETSPPPSNTGSPRLENAGSDARKSLRQDIETLGVLGGLATRIRGAADEYIQDKLNEIEQRIDQKLNQIDERLAEWRDRELAHRLRILRVTLAFSVLVALVSLGYNYLKHQSPSASDNAAAPAARIAGDSHGGEP